MVIVDDLSSDLSPYGYFHPQASGADAREIPLCLTSAMVELVEKLTVLEFCEAKISEKKLEVVRAMACLVFMSNPFSNFFFGMIKKFKIQ
ncbi:unnamed protein product [Arabis nemorensis]|uniref:Uncharacterized protein n=1 Tax=Arabis nemorensis TaxID=586526 RepID=A0A565BIV5_9BRAS|nr:unnamed protein product [Arabis nemorensis]